MSDIETTSRIEPALIDEPSSAIADVVADLTAAVSMLGKFLHPLTAANLADAVRIMNTYYSNLIEGHNTRPRDIERALSGELDQNEERRNLQIEAAGACPSADRNRPNVSPGHLAPRDIRWICSVDSQRVLSGRFPGDAHP